MVATESNPDSIQKTAQLVHSCGPFTGSLLQLSNSAQQRHSTLWARPLLPLKGIGWNHIRNGDYKWHATYRT